MIIAAVMNTNKAKADRNGTVQLNMLTNKKTSVRVKEGFSFCINSVKINILKHRTTKINDAQLLTHFRKMTKLKSVINMSDS